MALLVLGLTGLTLVRIAVLFVSPLELYPDEAQYWLWSRQLAFGYFSKPPLIAWLIRGATTLGGQGEAWVRICAPLMHGLAALFLALAGRRLYGAATGAAAAAIYSLAPGVQLSCAVIATDAPLMACLSLALWAYACWWTASDDKARRWAAAGFGLALGAAFLAKYAALYFAGAAIVHALFSGAARARWRLSDALLTVACLLLIAAPNIVWNGAHHFQTVAHTASNANLDEDSRRVGWLDPRGWLGYIVGQFGVFGPIAFGVFVAGAATLWRKKRLLSQDVLLLAFAAPPLLIVLFEAAISRANANWAGAAYGPIAILVAAMLLRWRAWGALVAILASQAVIAAIFLTVFAAPGLADRAGFANSFKRARGWAASTVVIERAASAATANGRSLTAVAVDDRFLFNALSYYARDADNRPAGALAAPLKMWVREAKPHNQAETMAPLDAASGARALITNFTPPYRAEIMADFHAVEPGLQIADIALDAKHQRSLALFVGDGFQRQSRDPRTGRPFRRRP